MSETDPLHVGSDIQTIIGSLDYPDGEALAIDLLAASDAVCRKNVRALQATLNREYDRLLNEELAKVGVLEEAEYKLQPMLRVMRERLLTFGVQQEEYRRLRDRNILEWVKKKLQ